VSDRIAHLADRVRADPFFLASALDVYARSEGIGDAALAERLGCEVETLARLALCRRPAAERFLADVEAIAERFGIDATELAAVVRRADVLEVLSRGMGASGTLMAARDREES